MNAENLLHFEILDPETFSNQIQLHNQRHNISDGQIHDVPGDVYVADEIELNNANDYSKQIKMRSDIFNLEGENDYSLEEFQYVWELVDNVYRYDDRKGGKKITNKYADGTVLRARSYHICRLNKRMNHKSNDESQGSQRQRVSFPRDHFECQARLSVYEDHVKQRVRIKQDVAHNHEIIKNDSIKLSSFLTSLIKRQLAKGISSTDIKTSMHKTIPRRDQYEALGAHFITIKKVRNEKAKISAVEKLKILEDFNSKEIERKDLETQFEQCTMILRDRLKEFIDPQWTRKDSAQRLIGFLNQAIVDSNKEDYKELQLS